MATAQTAGNLRLGAGQHVRIATHDGATLSGYVRATTDTSIRLRVRGFADDSIVSVARAAIVHAEVAELQDYSERKALIGGVAGLATGALVAWALNRSESCSVPGECVRIDFLPLTSALGFAAGLLLGWFQRPSSWVTVMP